jgi:Flp pilus assembly protein TadD
MANNDIPVSQFGNGSTPDPQAKGTSPQELLARLEKALANGQMVEAEHLASEALALSPDNAQAYHFKGVSLLARGHAGEATQLLAKSCQLDPRQPLVQMRLGIAHAMDGDAQGSLAALREAVRLAPEMMEAHTNLGITLLKLENWPEAANVFERVVTAEGDNLRALDGLGTALVALDRFSEACQVLRQAVLLAPGQASAHANLSMALSGIGNQNESLKAMRLAADLAPKDRQIQLNLAHAYMSALRPVEAMAACENLLELAPDWPEAMARYANALEKHNRPADARLYVQRALTLEPENSAAGLTLLRLHLRAKDYRQAVDLGEKLLTRNAEDKQRRYIHFEMGRGLEKLGRYDQAFEAYAASQKVAATLPEMRNADRSVYPAMIERSRAWFHSERVDKWPRRVDDGVTAPVFFVGVPRSGTTLVERMLKAHPSCITGDEYPWLNRTMEQLPGAYPSGCENFSDAEVRALRRFYFDRAGSDINDDLEDRRLIDKFPMNITYLGFVRRIFPEAKILVALRDPRDVTFSCFTQPFEGKDGTIHFQELESSALFCAKIMDLWFHFQDTLGLSVMSYRYEDLTREPEAVSKEIMAFLEINWDPAVLKHHEKTEGAFIRTASRESVTDEIHTQAVSRWRNFEKYMAPVLPILVPYIDALGYEKSQ